MRHAFSRFGRLLTLPRGQADLILPFSTGKGGFPCRSAQPVQGERRQRGLASELACWEGAQGVFPSLQAPCSRVSLSPSPCHAIAVTFPHRGYVCKCGSPQTYSRNTEITGQFPETAQLAPELAGISLRRFISDLKGKKGGAPPLGTTAGGSMSMMDLICA